jgi:hypothetical protein
MTSQALPAAHPLFVTGLHWTPASVAETVTHLPPEGAMDGTVHWIV